jgi:DNA topoisomerase-1
MNVVIVESPAKAKTINKYLGADYKVLASYGHVRDLLAKDGAVDPENGFAMQWQVDDRAKKQIGEIRKALKGADHLFLATDPDREGEAISWHVLEVLAENGGLKNIDVKRVVFHEITKRVWRAAPWTSWWASPCRRCCGANCRARSRRGACSRWRCG